MSTPHIHILWIANDAKIASRMWHRPFGILIDATCYNGQNEPQDVLFRKLDLLTPFELSKQLSRVYVYNMNSAFR
jgi:neurofibromin 1